MWAIRILAKWKHWLSFIGRDAKSWGTLKIPLRGRLRALRHGFLSETYLIHDLANSDLDLFLPDYAIFTKTPRIDQPFSSLLHNRLAFALMMPSLGLGNYIPRFHGLISATTAYAIGERKPVSRMDFLQELLSANKAIVVKPLAESQGVGILVLSKDEHGVNVNGKCVSSEVLSGMLDRYPHNIVEEFITPHDYARQIFPHATNTIRMVTMYDAEQRECFLAACNHRFGTTRSAPVDNWSQGGVWTQIEPQTGTLGKWISHPGAYDSHLQDRHPETGARIQGVCIPHWDAVKADVLRIASAIPFLPYVGWDIVVTDNGCKILEGNENPGIGLGPGGRPLLSDPRVRAFYKRYGVI